MIDRNIAPEISKALSRQPAVALVGPRQVGKTTLALEIADKQPSIYLDLERAEHRNRLNDITAFCAEHEDKLIVLDEIHRVPDLFEELRGIIDDGRRKGLRTGRFLVLGSASMDLMRQSETLAGRIAYLDVPPLGVADYQESISDLWVRGGYPESLLALDDENSFRNRKDFIRSYLERDVPMFAPRMPVATIERLWTMLAHNQGGLLNVSQLSGSLGIANPTTQRYIDLLCDLLLVRRLQPYLTNVGKRLVKSPRTYIRDSGLVHALLNIKDHTDLLGNPVAGQSWEGFVIENILNALPYSAVAGFYRSRAGAEIDLVIDMASKGKWAIEIKLGRAPKLTKGFFSAQEDIQPDKSFVLYSGNDRYPYNQDTDVIGLPELIKKLQSL